MPNLTNNIYSRSQIWFSYMLPWKHKPNYDYHNYTPALKKWGVYWFTSVRGSVRPSVRPSVIP